MLSDDLNLQCDKYAWNEEIRRQTLCGSTVAYSKYTEQNPNRFKMDQLGVQMFCFLMSVSQTH